MNIQKKKQTQNQKPNKNPIQPKIHEAEHCFITLRDAGQYLSLRRQDVEEQLNIKYVVLA